MALQENGGVASCYIDGAYIQVAANITFKMGGLTRKMVKSSDGVAGYVTVWMEPELDLEAIDGPSVSLTAFKAVNGQTIQLKMNNGKIYQLYQAVQIEDPQGKADAGLISGLKFSGARMQEITA
ncbi:MAG: phage tail tube protein [Rhodospirillales bacterium]|nr:phage tail tube protein [Rhodospirillales bacterium]